MSLIGTLEQFSLSNVLQRIEAHGKTGLLVLKQGAQWVELYVRDGRLLCIGPVRTNAHLGERLLQDGFISPTVLQETLLVIGAAEKSETRIAITLIDLGYVSRDELRAWAIQKAVAVIQALLLWGSGEIYFEEGQTPPAERLLVSIAFSQLLEQATTIARTPPPQVSQPTPPPQSPRPLPQAAPATYSTLASHTVQEPPKPQPMMPTTPRADVARVPTLMEASQFVDDSTFVSSFPSTGAIPYVPPQRGPETPVTPPQPADAVPATESFLPIFNEREDVSFSSLNSGLMSQAAAPLIQPVPVMHPMPPRQIDTSFMRPDMILFPVDLTAYREQNPQVQITPEQWRLLTRVDGQTSLQAACQELAMLPEMVCQVAGELMAEGLIHVILPEQVQELSPIPREYIAGAMNNGYVAPGYAAAPPTPWSTSMPGYPADVAPPFPAALPFETRSQWGNGGNGATFVPGRGWITSTNGPQPAQPGDPMASSGIYMQTAGYYQS